MKKKAIKKKKIPRLPKAEKNPAKKSAETVPETPVPYGAAPVLPAVRENPDDYIRKMRRDQGYMPLGDHLEELRWRIFRSLFWFLGFFIITWIFTDEIWSFVMGPLAPIFAEAPQHHLTVKLITTKLGDYFMIQIRVCTMAALVLAIPMILYELLRFFQPALAKVTRVKGYLLLFFAVILFYAGIATARFYIWPLVGKFLIYQWIPPDLEIPGLQGPEKIRPEVYLTISDYLSFFFGFHFAFGISFELPIISVILAMIGILRSSVFWSSWRYAVVFIAVISALVTPPDVFSMVAMMIPLLILYFVSALLVLAVERKKEQG